MPRRVVGGIDMKDRGSGASSTCMRLAMAAYAPIFQLYFLVSRILDHILELITSIVCLRHVPNASPHSNQSCTITNVFNSDTQIRPDPSPTSTNMYH